MPTVRVSLSGTGLAAGDTIQLMANAAAIGSALTLTQDQVATGYVDITTPPLSQGAVELTAVGSSAGGSATSAGHDLRVDTVGPHNNDVTAVYDDDGLVAKFGITNDRTLIAETRLAWNGDPAYAPAAGDTLQLIVDGRNVGAPVTITAEDIASGYARLTAPEIGYGEHWFRVQLTDQAGNPPSSANAYPFTVAEQLPPEILQVIDDTAPQTGNVAEGGFTNDTVLTARISLEDTQAQAGDTLVFSTPAPLGTQGQEKTVVLSAADITAGYVDLNTGTLAMSSTGREGWTHLTTQIRYADGRVGLTDTYNVRLTTDRPDAPLIEAAADDVGPATGALASGATTDDSTPTFTLRVDTDPGATWTPPPPPPQGSPGHPSPPPHYSATVGAPVDLYANGVKVGSGVVDDASLQITSAQLAAGTYSFTAVATDKAGNQSLVSPAFNLTISGGTSGPGSPAEGQVITSDQYADSLVGGAGADTLNAGQGPDTLTGNGGGDAFVYAKLPWNAGRATDFTVGADRLDLSALFQASGYAGSDPVADGYVKLESDGAGGTKVFYDTDATGGGNTIQFLITTLDGVSTSGLTWAQLSGEVQAGPTAVSDSDTVVLGSSEPATGNVLTDAAPGDQGDGDDGADLPGSQGPLTVSGIRTTHTGDFEPDSNGNFVQIGRFGTVTINVDGSYSYVLNSNPEPGVTDVFGYQVRDAAGEVASASLGIQVLAAAPSGDGEVLTSDQYGDSLVGGPGADTLNAGQGPDVLTGGGGGDAFVYAQLPWNAGHATDFTLGSDRLDLSAIFQASGYTGSDPVADGRMRFDSDGAGGTRVYFDADAPNSGDWPFLITTLDNVSPTGLTWAQLSGDGSSEPPPPSGEGQVLTWDQHGDTLTGGAGADTLNASRGPDQLTGAGGADHFAWAELPWNSGHVTDFTPGSDKLDLRALFEASGYAGSDPIADGRLEFRADGAGNTQVYFDADAPGSGDWPWLITTLDAVAPGQIGAGDWLFQ